MRQIDTILARFPEPVMLHVGRTQRLLGLALCLGFVAFFVWLLFFEYPQAHGYLSGAGGLSGIYRAIMAWATIAFFGALAIRGVIVLLFPDTASLTLDVTGFMIGSVFGSMRFAWRDVSEFRVDTSRTGKVGGPLTQIIYHDLDAERRGAKSARVLPEIYGRPKLGREELAELMNEWRGRALAF